MVYIKNNLIGSDSNMCLTVDYLTEINYMITGSNSIILRIGNLKPHDDENGRTCKILFANDDKINLLIRQKLKT